MVRQVRHSTRVPVSVTGVGVDSFETVLTCSLYAGICPDLSFYDVFRHFFNQLFGIQPYSPIDDGGGDYCSKRKI